jgi:RNA polymerase sigma-70 factor, ECF subfamily
VPTRREYASPVAKPAITTTPFAQDPLLERLLAGEPAAYEALIREHGAQMLAVARRLLGNEHDAQEAVQDAFLSAFRSIGRFESGSRLGTWLHRIVVNAALMKRRTAARRPARSIDDILPKFRDDGHRVEPAAAWNPPPDRGIEQAELAAAVRACIDQLPDQHRLVLLLRDIEGLDTEATAAELGITPGAVKTRLHRARQALRELLDPRMREDAT